MAQLDTLANDPGLASDRRQYLTFTMGTEEYGVDILTVQEIRGYSSVTPIPNTPRYIKGVMNLRGTIVPVIDLRSRLLGAEGAPTGFTAIVVLMVGQRTVGVIVDSVSDVLSIRHADIHATPDFGPRVDMRLVSGLARAGDRLVILLDIDRILVADESEALLAAS
jgi:purine-binding chemotaxis protein CheW